jgi:DNA-binding NarL/FixJ family response regulator
MLELAHILVVGQPSEATRTLVFELQQRGYRVTGVAQDLEFAAQLAEDSHVALVSLSSPAAFDVIAIGRALIAHGGISVLYVMPQLDSELLAAARESRPHGFLFEPFTMEALCGSIELVRPLRVAEPKAGYMRELDDEMQLTPREQEVFDALLQGMRPPEIARTFFISIHTVRRHAQAVFRKRGVHSQIELMHRFGAGGPRTKTK